MRRRVGFALLLAISIAMVCFLVATAMVAISRTDLRSTTLQALKTRRYFAARGQVQELIALVKAGNRKFGAYPGPPDGPYYTGTVGGMKVKAWAVQDPNDPYLYRVYAEVAGVTSESAVMLGGPGGPGTFTSVVNSTGNPVAFFSQSGQQQWTMLPAVPKFVYLPKSRARSHLPGNFDALAVKSYSSNVAVSAQYTADDQGELFASTLSYSPAGVGLQRYDPNSHSWKDLGAVPGLAAGPDGGAMLGGVATRMGEDFGEQWVVTRDGKTFYDRIDLGPNNYIQGTQKGDEHAVIKKLDVATGAWTLINGPGDGLCLGAIAGKPSGGMVAAVMNGYGPPTSQVASLDGGSWSYLPNAPFAVDSLAVAPDGTVYAAGYRGGKLDVAKCTPGPGGGGWTDGLAPPGADPPLPGGGGAQLISVDSDGSLICRTDADQTYERYDKASGSWQVLPSVAHQAGQSPWSVIGAGGVQGGSGIVEKISR